MDKVYIVEYYVPYESREIIKVFSSEEKAIEFVSENKKNYSIVGYLDYIEYEVL